MEMGREILAASGDGERGLSWEARGSHSVTKCQDKFLIIRRVIDQSIKGDQSCMGSIVCVPQF